MYPIDLLSASDKRVRRCWLVLFLIGFVPLLICTGVVISQIPSPPQSAIGVFLIAISIVIVIFTGFCFFYPFYFCGFKNPGTKLLFLQAIFSILSPVWSLNETIDTGTALDWVFFISGFLFSYATAYLCLRLRNINMKVNQMVLNSSNDLANACVALQESRTLDALNSCFQKVAQTRSKNFIRALKRMYDKRKEEIELGS